MQGIGHGGNVPSDKTAVFQSTEDLVGSVVHVLNYRQELRGWTQKKAPGSPTSVQVLAAHLFSEMKLQGKCHSMLPGPRWVGAYRDRKSVV